MFLLISVIANNSRAKTSESQENHEEMFSQYTCNRSIIYIILLIISSFYNIQLTGFNSSAVDLCLGSFKRHLLRKLLKSLDLLK